MKKWQIALVAVAIVAVAVAALFGGRAWGQSTSSNDADLVQAAGQGPGNGNAPGMPGDGSLPTGGPGGTGRNGLNPTSGSIVAADDTSITVKTANGSTKMILVSASTSVTKTVVGSLSDLVTGENVVISGTTNSDDTITASNIVLRSDLGFGGMPGGTAPPSGEASAPVGGSTTPTTAE